MTSRNRLLRDVVRQGRALERIAELGDAAASYDFQNIPQNFRHLLLVTYGRSDTAAMSAALRMRLQNLSTAVYYAEAMNAAAAAVSAAEILGATSATIGSVTAASASAVLSGTVLTLIPHYTQANKEKPFISLSTLVTAVTSGGITLSQFGGICDTSAPIDRVTVFPAAGSFVADSICTLYGLPV